MSSRSSTLTTSVSPSSFMRQNDFLRTRRHGVRNQVPSSTSGSSRPSARTSSQRRHRLSLRQSRRAVSASSAVETITGTSAVRSDVASASAPVNGGPSTNAP